LLAGSLSAYFGFAGFKWKEFVVGPYVRLVVEREKSMKFGIRIVAEMFVLYSWCVKWRCDCVHSDLGDVWDGNCTSSRVYH